MSSSVPGLGGAASEPSGAVPPSKKGPPVISGSNALGEPRQRKSINAARRCEKVLNNASLL